MKTELELKTEALSTFLGIDKSDITLECSIKWEFSTESDGDYLVLTDEESNLQTEQEILDSLWAFNANFIIEHSPIERSDNTITAIKTLCQTLNEDANPIVKAIIGDSIDSFIDDAINTDGRGHFLSHYDSDESELTIDEIDCFIYRTN